MLEKQQNEPGRGEVQWTSSHHSRSASDGWVTGRCGPTWLDVTALQDSSHCGPPEKTKALVLQGTKASEIPQHCQSVPTKSQGRLGIKVQYPFKQLVSRSCRNPSAIMFLTADSTQESVGLMCVLAG